MAAQQFNFSSDMRFNNYTGKNNFVSVYFRCMIRSKKGYLWAVGNGLNRFDGKQYVNYNSYKDDQHHLRETYITDLFEDRFERIWVAGDGLSYFDEKQDRFIHINIDSANNIRVAYGLCNTRDKLWFTSDNGLYSIDITTLQLKRTSLKSNPDYPVNYAFDSNTIVHAGYSTHFYVYHINEDRYDSIVIRRQGNIVVSDMTKAAGKLWFATSDGLWVSDNIRSQPRQIQFTSKIVVNELIAIQQETGDSLLVMATEKNGLLVYNIRKDKIEFAYTSDKNNPYSLPGNEVNGMFLDDDNTLWLCTNNGLSSIDGSNQLYKERAMEGQYPIKLSQDLYQKNVAWISVHQIGILKVDWDSKRVVGFYPLQKIADPAVLGEGIYDMQQIDRYNWLLLAHSCLVIWNANTATGKVIDNFPLAKNHRGLYLRYIIPHNKDSCFITGNNGMFLFHIKSGKIDTAILRRDFSSHDCNIMNGTNDRKGVIWLAARHGLVKYCISTGDRKWFFADERIDKGNFMWDAAITSNGKIVCGTSGGIAVLDTGTERFVFFDKFRSTRLWCGTVDITDSIAWINSTGGLVRINTNSWVPTLLSPSSDGETFSDFRFGRVNDEFVWLSRGRYVYFKPAVVASEPLPARTVIEKVVVNKKASYYPGADSAWSLTYEQNNINFYFTAFEFNNANGIQFRYKLQGIDGDWNFVGGAREANYINVPPGKYTFIVQSGNVNGEWNMEPATFSFTIIPPYWQRWWFQLAVVVGFIGTVVAIAAARIRSIKRRELEKTAASRAIAEMELKALRSQMNPHFIFNSLNSIQKFIWENKQEDASEYLTKFARLMRQILDSSMNKLITLEQELSTLALYIELEHRRSNNKFDYRINVDDNIDAAHILVPSLILQPYIENAIWHGLLQKDGRGELVVSVEYKADVKEIRYTVEDNGIGRKKAGELRAPKTGSYGMQITEQRLAISDQGGRPATVRVEDKYDEQGNATGTKIAINIPITDFIKV